MHDISQFLYHFVCEPLRLYLPFWANLFSSLCVPFAHHLSRSPFSPLLAFLSSVLSSFQFPSTLAVYSPYFLMTTFLRSSAGFLPLQRSFTMSFPARAAPAHFSLPFPLPAPHSSLLPFPLRGLASVQPLYSFLPMGFCAMPLDWCFSVRGGTSSGLPLGACVW